VNCFSSNTDTLMGLDLSDADQRIAALGGPGRWLERGRIYVGDRADALAAFGGEYVDGVPRNYLILVDPQDGIPYAQQFIGQETPGGLPAWVAGDEIHICGDNWD
jgi:hypothetical protein